MIPKIYSKQTSNINYEIIEISNEPFHVTNAINLQKIENLNFKQINQQFQNQNVLHTERNNQRSDLDNQRNDLGKLANINVIRKYDEELMKKKQLELYQDNKLDKSSSKSNQKYSELLYQINDKKTKHYGILQQQQEKDQLPFTLTNSKDLLPFTLTNSKQLLKASQNDKTIQQIVQKQKGFANVTAKKIINKINSKKGKMLHQENMVQIQRIVLQKIVLQNQKLKQSISELIKITKKLKKNQQILKQARDINRSKIQKLSSTITELNQKFQQKQLEISSLNQEIQKLRQEIKQSQSNNIIKLDQKLLNTQNSDIKNMCKLHLQKSIEFVYQPAFVVKIDTLKSQGQQRLEQPFLEHSLKQNILQSHLQPNANIEQLVYNQQKYEEQFIKKYKCNHCNNFINQFFNMKQQVIFSKQKINTSQLQINRLEVLEKEHLQMISNYMNKISKLQKFNREKQEKVDSLIKENSVLSQKNYTLDHGQYNIKLQKLIDQLKQDNNILTKNYVNLQDQCQSLYKVRQNLQQKIKIAQQIQNQLENYKIKQQRDQTQITQLQNQLMRQKKHRNDNQNILREQYHLLYEEHKQFLQDYEKQCQKTANLQVLQTKYQQLKSKYEKLQTKNEELNSINQVLNNQFKSTVNKVVILEQEVKRYQKQLKKYESNHFKSQIDPKKFEFLQNEEFLQFDILNNQAINSSMLVPLYNKIEMMMHENQSLKTKLQETYSRITELQQVNNELNEQLSNKDISLRQSQHKIKLLSDQIQAKQHQIQIVMSKRTIQSNISDQYNECESRRRVSLNDDLHSQNSRRRYTLKFQSSNQKSNKKSHQQQSQSSSEQKNIKQLNDQSISSSEAVQMIKVQSQIKEAREENIISSQENLLQSQKKISDKQQSKLKHKESSASISQGSMKISKYEMISPRQSQDNQKSPEQIYQQRIYELTSRIQVLKAQLLREQTDKQQVIQSTHRVWQQKEITQKQLQKQTQIIIKQKREIQIFEKQTHQLSSRVNLYFNQYNKVKVDFFELTNKISMINNESFKSLTSLKNIPIEHQYQVKVQQLQQNNCVSQVQQQLNNKLSSNNPVLIQKVDPSQLLLNLVSNLICNTILQITLQDLIVQQQKQQYHYSYVKFMEQSISPNKMLNSQQFPVQYKQNQNQQQFILKICQLQDELKITREDLAYKIKKIQILQELQTQLTLDQKKLRQYLQVQTKQKKKLIQQRNSLQKLLQELKLELQNQENTYNSIAMQKCALQADIKRNNDEKQVLIAQNTTLKSQIKRLSQQIYNIRLQNEELNYIAKEKFIVDVKEYKFYNNDMTETISSNVSNKNQQLQNMENCYGSVSVQQLQKQNLKQSKQISSLQVQNKNMIAQNQKLSVQLSQSKQKIKKLQQQISRLYSRSSEKSQQIKQNSQKMQIQLNHKYSQEFNQNKTQQESYYLSRTQPNQFSIDKNGPAKSSSSLKFSETQNNLSSQMEIKLMDLQRLEAQIVELREQLDRKSHFQEEVQRLSLKIQELENQLNKQKNQRNLSPIQQQGDQNSKNGSSDFSNKLKLSVEEEIPLRQQQSSQNLETSLQKQHKNIFISLNNKNVQTDEIQHQSEFENILSHANKIFGMIAEYIQNYQETTTNEIDQHEIFIQNLIKQSNIQVIKAFQQSKNSQKNQLIDHQTQSYHSQTISPMERMFHTIKYRLKILKKLQSQKYLSIQENQQKIQQLNQRLEQEHDKLFVMTQKVKESQAISQRYEEILMQMLNLEQQKKCLQQANQKIRSKNTQLKTQVSQLITQIQKLTKINQTKTPSIIDAHQKNDLIQQIQRLKQENHLQRKQLEKSEYELLKLGTLLQKYNNNIADNSQQNLQISRKKLTESNYVQFLKEIINKIQLTQQQVQNIQASMGDLKQRIRKGFSKNKNSQNVKKSSKDFDKQNSFNQILDNSLNNSPNKVNDSPDKLIQLQHLQQLQKKLTQNDALMKKYKHSLQNDLSNLMKEILQAEQHQTISRNKFQSYLQKIQQKIHTQFNPDSRLDILNIQEQKQKNKKNNVSNIKNSREVKDSNKDYQLQKIQKQNRNRFYTQNRPSTMVGNKKYDEFDISPSSLSSSQKLKFDILKIKQKVFQKLSSQMTKHLKKLQILFEQLGKKYFSHNSWLAYTPKYVFKIIETIILNLSKKQNLKSFQNETLNSDYQSYFSTDIQQKIVEFCLYLKEIEQQFQNTVLQFSNLGKMIQTNMQKVSNKFISYSKKEEQPYLSINDIESQQNISLFQQDFDNNRVTNKKQSVSKDSNFQTINLSSSQKMTNFSSPMNDTQSHLRTPFSIKQINQIQNFRSNTLTRRQSEHILNESEKDF